MGPGSTQHATHAMHLLMRLQWLTRSAVWVLATSPTCGANGRGKLTAATAVNLLLAVALQPRIAPVFHHLSCIDAPALATERPQPAALAMGHLVRVHVSGFSKPDPQTQSQHRQHCVVVAPIQGGGSGGSDTSRSGIHDSPGNRTGGSSQEVMRGL